MDNLKVNKASWDKRTEVHITSEFYDVEGFTNGKCALNQIEIEGLGDVTGKSLLHLQCHFGLDTLSWARLGAKVTGVDLSSVAIDKANMLSAQMGLDSTFVCSDLYSFGEQSHVLYDIVFTSYGALCWLPDIEKWAKVVADSLKPGGTFYIAEFHPFYDLFSGYSYFYNPEPDIEQETTYTENHNNEASTIVVWSHPLSNVINALIKAGIQISEVNEYPFSPYNCFEGMEKREEGKFYLSHKGQDIPLVYSIKGCKRKV